MLNTVKLLFLLVILVSIELHSQGSLLMAHRAISRQEANISRIRDCNSSIVSKSKLDNTNSVVNKYILNQNYPNPFNPLTTIEFSIPKVEFISLKVYDILGKEVSVLVNEERSTGNYKVVFDSIDLPSGVYYYHLRAGAFSSTRKFVLLK